MKILTSGDQWEFSTESTTKVSTRMYVSTLKLGMASTKVGLDYESDPERSQQHKTRCWIENIDWLCGSYGMGLVSRRTQRLVKVKRWSLRERVEISCDMISRVEEAAQNDLGGRSKPIQ